MARLLFDLLEKFAYDTFELYGQSFGRVVLVQIRHVDKYRSIFVDAQRSKVNVLAQIPVDVTTAVLTVRPRGRVRHSPAGVPRRAKVRTVGALHRQARLDGAAVGARVAGAVAVDVQAAVAVPVGDQLDGQRLGRVRHAQVDHQLEPTRVAAGTDVSSRRERSARAFTYGRPVSAPQFRHDPVDVAVRHGDERGHQIDVQLFGDAGTG